jgi:hypothetical protein
MSSSAILEVSFDVTSGFNALEAPDELPTMIIKLSSMGYIQEQSSL